jgi:uncharacterized LabA/DUF88 family protein
MAGNTQKVIVYIDGFNFYFGLKSKKWKKYYWLDLVKFCNQFLKPHQELVEVNYFSAVSSNNKAKQDRQDLFFTANKLNSKFNLHLGKFLKKSKTCNKCNFSYDTFEEKETDVRIATNIIRDVVLNKCTLSILITADSDLIPPIDCIKEIAPLHKIIVYFPPDRFSYDLKNKASNFLKLDAHKDKFEKSMLPENITLANGYSFSRPNKWK